VRFKVLASGESPRRQNSKFKVFEMPFRVLSSKTFLLWLIGGWIIYYVSSAIWMRESFANFVVGMQTKLAIRILFILFLISGYLNIVRVSMDIFKKGRLLFFTWIFFPLGFIVFLSGFFISISTRQFDWITVGEGHTVKPRWSSETCTIGSIKSGLEDSFLDTDVRFGKGIFKYEPKITILDKTSKAFEVGAFPPTKIGNTYYHILNFGLAPGIRLSEKGSVRAEGYMPLKILLPGSSDYSEIQPYPYRFLISLLPEKTIQKGSETASQFNLKKPVYKIKVFKGEKVIAEGDSREEIKFDDITISVFDSTFWILLEAVKDLAVPVVLSGIFLTALGIPLYLLRFFLKLSGKI